MAPLSRSPLTRRPLDGTGVMGVVLGVLLMAGVAGVAVGASPCHEADPVGPCFKVHGRMSLYNGTPSVRIWIVGTRRVLDVEPSEAEIMPEILSQQLDGDFDVRIYGDFKVCPLDEFKLGEMQSVCVETVTNVVIEKPDRETMKRKTYRLPGTFRCCAK